MKPIKSQAIAFVLGFALTSFALFVIPSLTKKTSQTNHAGDQKLAIFHDSTAVTKNP